MKLLRNLWMVTHMLTCVGAVMLGYDNRMPWWQVLILVSTIYFANDILLSLVGLFLGRRRLSRITRDLHIPTIQSHGSPDENPGLSFPGPSGRGDHA